MAVTADEFIRPDKFHKAGRRWCMFRENGVKKECDCLFYTKNKADCSTGNGSGRLLQPEAWYCRHLSTVKKLGSSSSFTGAAPAWCPKRKADERRE